MRTRLSGDLTVDIPLPGDAGTGAWDNPYSIQPAIDMVFADYDLAGHGVTFKLRSAPGGGVFYKGFALSGRFVGQSGLGIPLLNRPDLPPFYIGRKGAVRLVGDPSYPRGAFIYPGPGEMGECITLSEGAALDVQGITMDTARTNKDCINVFNGAYLNLSDILFGNAGYPPNSFNNHLSLAFGSTCWISGKVTVSGSGASFATIGNNSALYWNNNGEPGYTLPFVLQNNPNFRDAFLQADNGIVYAHAVGFSGSATGRRWVAMRNGVVSTNSADPNYLPGSMPGMYHSGGQYL